MVTFLSDAWIAAMDAAVAAHPGLRHSTAGIALAVQQTVTRDAEAPVTYVVRFDHGENRVRAGSDAAADVTFTSNEETAAALAQGRLSAQEAFMAGRLRIGGSTRILMQHQSVLTGLDDALAGVRADTDFATGVAPGEPGEADGRS